jgi:hypothetical protein
VEEEHVTQIPQISTPILVETVHCREEVKCNKSIWQQGTARGGNRVLGEFTADLQTAENHI